MGPRRPTRLPHRGRPPAADRGLVDQEGAVDNNEMMLSFTIAAFTSITTLLNGESFHIGGGSPDIKTKGTHTFPERAPIFWGISYAPPNRRKSTS